MIQKETYKKWKPPNCKILHYEKKIWKKDEELRSLCGYGVRKGICYSLSKIKKDIEDFT